ncbi:MAG: 23S rRNA (pseudouridine(1915)-N(3))-methyltransferase RlmH [Betaproteobacteria bacterium]|nr:23S rRNA (pseudouridine(1915)-N(3))-methyltransferase RlmH [Betaproteobacteria bacterium]PWB57917.1 MAG: 23S rRNA (pseudouridine(1915)-N(3))-methyltransferase RlmH [Betaproteobacteria bacterium]
MRVSVVCVGHKMPAWIQAGFGEYAKRLPPEIRLEVVELKPEEKTSGKTVEKARALEGERILAAIPGGATVYALDEKGRPVTTQGLSVLLAGWMRDATHPAFVIGGADGLSEAVRNRADKLVSLSALTLPHGLVRVLLAEQLYRAWTILAGHPYHRE